MPSRFRSWVTPDGAPGPEGGGGFKAEPGRYHLYVAHGCPWAHRTLIFRKLKKLENAISLSIVAPAMDERGWWFGDVPGSIPDTVNGKKLLGEVYLLADPHYTGRVTVPVLWDKQRKTIVNNESSEIIRMFNSAFDEFTNAHEDYYPAELRAEIDKVNELVYANVNNGVYRAGFALTQAAYEEAFEKLFAALDQLEARLVEIALPGRQPRHRGRLAAVRDAVALRRGLLRAVQVQPAPDRRLSESLQLPARPLPGAGRGRDREHGSHQAQLLPGAADHQPARHRAGSGRSRISPGRTTAGASGTEIFRSAPASRCHEDAMKKSLASHRTESQP